MKFYHLIHALLFAAALPAFANVTLVRSYHLGDLDPGPTNELAAAFSRDYISFNTLQLTNGPTYSTDVPIDYPLINTYSVRFTGTNYGSAPVLTNLTDNFGLSAWVKPCSITGNHAIVYNGDTGGSGWGLYQVGDTFQVLFGGIDTVGSAPVVTNAWTHLALVRDQGTTTFYVNGVASGTSTATPNAPAGLWAIGSSPPSLGSEFFDGWIDEAAVFTFAPGAFSTNDLGYRSPAARMLTPLLNGTDVVITWPTLRNDFQLEFTTNLAAGLWIPMPYSTNTNSGIFTATEAAVESERYYRLHKPAPDLNAPLVPVLTQYQSNFVSNIALRKTINLAPIGTLNSGVNYYEMDATGVVHPRTGTPEALSYHWTIIYPSVDPYADAGIWGYHKAILKIQRNSLAQVATTPFVRFRLEITDDLSPVFPGITTFIFATRVNSDLTLSQFSTCQQSTNACPTCSCLFPEALMAEEF
ncbi:MAG: hypothetical protein JWM68_1308 [Verrucomicrobiales bacterium]|nr:hypothetical protein [Verrucomicrobiales bacterium]